MVLPILTYPNELLRKVCPPLDLTGDLTHIVKFIDDLEDTLEESADGAALAATQVGSEMRLFVTDQLSTMRFGMATSSQQVMGIPPMIINPTIVRRSKEISVSDEGCLSFPGILIPVSRHVGVEVKYSWICRGAVIEETRRLVGFWARCFQHEIDHLDGKLFVDSLSVTEREKIAMKVRSR